MTTTTTPDSRWTRRRDEKQRRLGLVKKHADGAVLPSDKIIEALEALILPGDRVVLEGNNQKQADFLSRSLAKADPAKLHDLHMIMPSVGRSEHLDLFEKGIARKLDFFSPAPNPCASASCWKTACWKSARSTPTSNSMRGWWWT